MYAFDDECGHGYCKGRETNMGMRQDNKNLMFLKPSPNEEVKLLQDGKKKLRKLRLQQVREQEKALANRIRKKFRQKENKELNLLGHELKRKWEDKITEEKTALESLYLENVSHVGEGHKAALEREHDGEPKATSLEDQLKVAERYKQALRQLKTEETERAQFQCEKNMAKHNAMEIERSRAARIAALEPPVPDIAESLEMIQKHKHQRKDIDEYSSTYYHVPQALVERANLDNEQVDARYAAKEEEERILNAKEDADRNFSEQMEKARLRHKHARSKLLLEKDHDKLIGELEYFERMDRQRRQDIVSKIPKHVFEPPHRRIEANEERQRDIEHAFEDMYMAQTNYMGDVSVAREPLRASPTATDDVLDISSEKDDEDVFPKQPWGGEGEKDVADSLESNGEELPNDAREQPDHGKKTLGGENTDKIRPGHKASSKYPLGRLMKKIDQQRDRWKSNKMKMMRDDKERHDTESTMSDGKYSEISEGPLTITTEKSSSIEPEHETLLHPHEEAERSRGAVSRTQGFNTEVEKQKQFLQEQKLKLQLQQQQVLQEHLQLQFDMLQHGIEIKGEENETDKESLTSKHSPHETDEDSNDVIAENKERVSSRLESLSSGLLSEDGVSVSDSVSKQDMAGSQSEDTRSDTPEAAADSQADVNLGRHEALLSTPESLGDDVFVPLAPDVHAPTLSILPQPKPLHIQVPAASLHAGSGMVANRGLQLGFLSREAPPMTTAATAEPESFHTGVPSTLRSRTMIPTEMGQPRFSSQNGVPRTTTATADTQPLHIEVPTSLNSGTRIPVERRQLSLPSPQIEAPYMTTAMDDPQPMFERTQKSVHEVQRDSVHPFSRPYSLFGNPPPLYSNADDYSPLPRQEHPQMHEPSGVIPAPSVLPTSIASAFQPPRGELPRTPQFPADMATTTDTASYLQFYQAQLMEQQERIRDQQRAIQQRQQQRLEQLRQFQDRLRSLRIDSGSNADQDSPVLQRPSTENPAYWRSLVRTSRVSDVGSSSAQDTPPSSDVETRGANDDTPSPVPRDLVENKTADQPDNGTLSKTTADHGDDATSSSLSRFQSDIVVARKFDERVLFPDPSELGLWSDSTIQLSSSDMTKTSSSAFEESSHRRKDKQPSSALAVRYESETSSSIKNGSSSDMNHSLKSVTNKSRTSFDSGPLSTTCSLPKSEQSLSSSASDTNNNTVLRMENSFQHFQDMIEEAKTLNEKYLGLNKPTGETSSHGVPFENAKEVSIDGASSDLQMSSSDLSHSFQEGNLSTMPEENAGIDNTDQLKTFEERREDVLVGIADDPADNSNDSGHVAKSNSRDEEDGVDTYNYLDKDSDMVVSSPHSTPFFSREGGNLVLGSDLPAYLVEGDPGKIEPSSFDINTIISTRPLSIIPEESVLSDDQLSEGVIEDDEPDANMLITSDNRRDFLAVSGTMVNVDSDMESERITQHISGGIERDLSVYSAFNVVPDGMFDSFQYMPLAIHEDDEDSFQGTVYKETVDYASDNRSGNHPQSSISYPIKNNRPDGEKQFLNQDSDISGNWSPSESPRLQDASVNKHMTTSKPSDELDTISLISPVETSDLSRQAFEVDVSGHSRLSLSQRESSSEAAAGLSLQEAFTRSQERFIENSKQRVRAAREARFQHSKPSVFEKPVKRSDKTNCPEVIPSGVSDGMSISQTSSSVKGLSSEDVVPVAKTLDTKRKIDKQDMIARTKRLYQKLPDVRQKQIEKQREGMYATNRTKAQEFEKQTRERLRKLSEKKIGKKK